MQLLFSSPPPSPSPELSRLINITCYYPTGPAILVHRSRRMMFSQDSACQPQLDLFGNLQLPMFSAPLNNCTIDQDVNFELDKVFRKRGRCHVCTRKKDRKTALSCRTCRKFTCCHHLTSFGACVKCSGTSHVS